MSEIGIASGRVDDFEVVEIEQLHVSPADQQQLILTLEILVLVDRVVHIVKTEVTSGYDNFSGLGENLSAANQEE
jgi:hypothetical protein